MPGHMDQAFFRGGAGRGEGTKSLPSSTSTHFLQRNHMPCHRSQEPQLPGNSIQARRPRHWSGCQETLPLMRLLSPLGAKTNRQNQVLDLEKVPETQARGDGGGGGGRVVSGLSSHEPGQPLPETNSRSTWHCLECFLWEILVNVYPLT